MSMARADLAATSRHAEPLDALLVAEDDNPARAFANAIVLAIPLWAAIGGIVAWLLG